MQKKHPEIRGLLHCPLFLWLVLDFIDRVHGHKGLMVRFSDVFHELAVFLLVHDGDNLPAGLIVISTDQVVLAGAAVEIMEDEVRDLLMLR